MSDDAPLVIAAVDTTLFLEPVVQRANHLAQCLDARLLVLHVYPAKSVNLANAASSGDMTLKSYEEQDMEAEAKLRQELEPRLKAVGLNSVVLEIAGGSVVRTIEEQLEKHHADLLVLGQPKALLGSVATKMTKNAACDVYIVRVPE